MSYPNTNNNTNNNYKLWPFRDHKEYFLVPADTLQIAHDAARRYRPGRMIFAVSKNEFVTYIENAVTTKNGGAYRHFSHNEFPYLQG